MRINYKSAKATAVAQTSVKIERNTGLQDPKGRANQSIRSHAGAAPALH